MSKKITLKDIQQAQALLKGQAQYTQMESSRSCSEWLGVTTYLKFENEQTTGSFKIRGAFNKISSLSPAERDKGIVACSAGNHAQGVAYSARELGAKAYIVMPETSPIVKVMATQSYGAEVILRGQIFDESYEYARQLEKEKNYTFVHPYNDPQIISGQGTVGLEILEQVPDLDSVVISIGGGGLISGVATAIKSIRPECKIFGVVSENAPGMYRLFKGLPHPDEVKKPTIADGIGVKSPNRDMFSQYIQPLVDDIITVSDEEIAEAIVFLLERAKSVVEGSGAITLAGAKKASWPLGNKTCLLLSGGNIDLNIVSKVIERGLSRGGRLARISVVVQDRPGTLQVLSDVIAQSGANILDVTHDRLRFDLQMSETAIEFLLETTGEKHVEEIHKSLQTKAIRVQRV